MTSENSGLSPAFIERQRQQLETLRDQLLQTEENTQGGELAQEAYGDEPRDSGDEGANMAQREINQALREVSDRRLANVERALEKIKEGSYGFSDASGEPIPKARLEAAPEAIYTVEEERWREGG